MGLLGDLRYFGPRLGAARAARLTAAKVAKAVRKRELRSELSSPTPGNVVCEDLGLSADPSTRVTALRGAWERLGPATHPTVTDPEHARRVADSVLAGRQFLFEQEVTLGWPPNWNWRWDGTENAATFRDDVRSTWEVQRLQGILPLAVASSVLQDESWAEAWFDGVAGFHAAHPGPDGVAWESALELGLRCVALVQGLVLVAPTDSFARRHLDALTVLYRHLRWLQADLSLDKVVRGNHLLGELAGLAAGHLLLAGDPRNLIRARLDLDLLDEEVVAQFHPDGVSVEQSLTYEAFILEFLVVAYTMAGACQVPLHPEVRNRLARAADHLEACLAPDGSLPRIGDADSGRGALLAGPRRALPELILRLRDLVGSGPGAGLGTPNGPHAPHVFPHGGHVTWRPRTGDSLFLRGGPFGWGIPGPASHSHCDLLAPVLHMGGEAVLVDPGVYGYRIGALRDQDRVWAAHSVLDLGPSVGPFPAGTFRWAGISDGEGLSAPTPDALSGTVELKGPNGPLIWQRSIRYNELDNAWLILDRLSGSPPGPVTWGFRFAPGVHIETEAEGRFRIRLPSGRVLQAALEPVGDTWVETGWVASAYGRRHQAPVLRRRVAGAFEEAVATFTPEH